MLFALGLIAAVCYVPGYTGASIPSQWVFLSIVLPFGLWRQGPFHPFHVLGLVFIAYALALAPWLRATYTSTLGIWYVLIWGLGFWLGSTSTSLRGLWQGLALGLTVSSGVAIAQALDYAPVEALHDQFPGLFYNCTVLGAATALTIIGCISHRLWWYLPGLAPALLLAGSRGSFVILGLTSIARWVHWSAAIVVMVVGLAYFTYALDPADSQRLQIWGVALSGLSWFGRGPDSFNDVFYMAKDKLTGQPIIIHPEFIHNDYLQLWFEYGIGAIAIYGIYAAVLTRRAECDWPVFFAFAVLGLFYFPLYCPLLALVGSLLAGHLLRSYDPLWAIGNRWGPNLISWYPNQRSDIDLARRQGLSLEPRHSYTEA